VKKVKKSEGKRRKAVNFHFLLDEQNPEVVENGPCGRSVKDTFNFHVLPWTVCKKQIFKMASNVEKQPLNDA
jgi:hypothetical protein